MSKAGLTKLDAFGLCQRMKQGSYILPLNQKENVFQESKVCINLDEKVVI